jgi:hypothetical protein
VTLGVTVSDASVESVVDDEQFAIFCQDADAKTPSVAAAHLRRLKIPHETVDALVARYEAHAAEIMTLDSPAYMRDRRHVTWYAGPQSRDKCWPALAKRLHADGLPADAIEVVDAATTRVVSLLAHPQTIEFRTKGLVIGYVQSGKTTNFTGVVAKAADRGYRLIIVLAGIHNELRRQTQDRLARHLVVPNKQEWLLLTASDRDFQPPQNAAAYFASHSNHKVLCVVKKNHRVLRKLIDWLATAQEQLQGIPAIVIDDEADQAAIATRTINPLVLELLSTLPKVAYIGYTATPFANLLIDPSSDDLYPESFIVDLPKPEDHFGTETIFGRDPIDGEDPADYDDGTLDVVRIVPDDEVPKVRPASNADVDGFTVHMGDELRKAILWFWLATAARRIRGTGVPHSTMLIHTSVRVNVQESFRAPITKLRDQIAGGLATPAIADELRRLWLDETARVPAESMDETPVSFDGVIGKLPAVLKESRVVLDNSRSTERLDYSGDPVVAIAVGGNTLSRGLTLEGLVVSYFVRSASAYDTLLQMGRWFGYRLGYTDLPRIWMTDELRRYFRFIAGVEAGIRRDVSRYMHSNETPLTLAVRIKAHPSLAITSAAKRRDAVRAASSYGGMRIQTRFYKADDDDWLRINQEAAHALVAAAVGSKATAEQLDAGVGRLWRNVASQHVIDFFAKYNVHPIDLDKQSSLLANYISQRNASGHLLDWNVAIVGSSSAKRGSHDFGSQIVVPRVIRARYEESPRTEADIKTLMSIRDAAVDLDLSEVKGKLEEDMIKDLRARQLPDTGLLVLYPIDRVSPPKPPAVGKRQLRTELGAERDVIGIGVLFPRPKFGEKDEEVYWQADLSNVATYDGYLEEDDVSTLEDE